MPGESAIEWTEKTWNPTTGCDRVSPGCANCYALTLAAEMKRRGVAAYQTDGDPLTSGPGFGLALHEDRLDQPTRWQKPSMIFVNSMSDLFHEDIPFSFLLRVFLVMRNAPRHTFQVLTKRPERMLQFLSLHRGLYDVEPNIWLGVSIENSRYSYRADLLREADAAVRFISAEPLLGSLFLSRDKSKPLDLTGIDWVIAGGESGPGYRPVNVEHIRELRDACLATRAQDARHLTSFFFKQWGGPRSKSGGKELDGRQWCEMPVTAVG